MLQLEHLNLVVKDMDSMLKFYQAAFPHWYIRISGNSEWYGKPRKWLHFGDDYQYLALADNGEGENRDLAGHQVGLAHFAFVTNDIEAMEKRLSEAGFERDKGGLEEPWRKNIYYIDPAGYEVEFVEYSSDIPAQRNYSSNEPAEAES